MKKGRPRHEVTDKTRAEVRTLSGFGARNEDIAQYIGITKATLEKYYAEELKNGKVKANAAIAETLFKKARDGNITACIFWLKTRAGWRETQKVEVTGDMKNNVKMETTLADLITEAYEKERS